MRAYSSYIFFFFFLFCSSRRFNNTKVFSSWSVPPWNSQGLNPSMPLIHSDQSRPLPFIWPHNPVDNIFLLSSHHWSKLRWLLYINYISIAESYATPAVVLKASLLGSNHRKLSIWSWIWLPRLALNCLAHGNSNETQNAGSSLAPHGVSW